MLTADFLTADLPTAFGVGRFRTVVGNPPFKDAVAFIERALALVPLGGHVAFLLRLNFLGSGTRRIHLLRDAGLSHVVVLTNRPSFCTAATCKTCRASFMFPAGVPFKEIPHPTTGCVLDDQIPKAKTPYNATRTDSCDYAWCVWTRGHGGGAALTVTIPGSKG